MVALSPELANLSVPEKVSLGRLLWDSVPEAERPKPGSDQWWIYERLLELESGVGGVQDPDPCVVVKPSDHKDQ
jgi:hypothetical protein